MTKDHTKQLMHHSIVCNMLAPSVCRAKCMEVDDVSTQHPRKILKGGEKLLKRMHEKMVGHLYSI